MKKRDGTDDLIKEEDASDIWEDIFEDLASEEQGQDSSSKHKRQNFGISFSDPMFREQWFLNGGARNGADMVL